MSRVFRAIKPHEISDVSTIFFNRLTRKSNVIIMGVLVALIFLYDESASKSSLQTTTYSVAYLFLILFLGSQFFQYVDEIEEEEEKNLE